MKNYCIDRLGIIGNVTITEIVTLYDEIVHTSVSTKKNIVVGNGRQVIAELLTGNTDKYIKYIALGDTKDSLASYDDASLNREIKRFLIVPGSDITYPSTGVLKFSRLISGNEFATTTVGREAGLFFSDGSIVFNSGTLFNRVILVDDNPPDLVNAGITFQPMNEYGVSVGRKIEFEIVL